MKPFTALDEILHAGAITRAAPRELATTPAFQPLFAKSLLPGKEPFSEAHGESKIELVQEDGRIRQIVVICRCGERTVLDCAYAG